MTSFRTPAFILAATLAGCAGGRSVRAPELTDLQGSLGPLRHWFEEHAGTPRVIMLLSPV
jgi:hypothetical protein